MAVYDPIIPDSYFRSWKAISGLSSPPALTGLGIFCARIDDRLRGQDPRGPLRPRGPGQSGADRVDLRPNHRGRGALRHLGLR